MGGTNTRAVVLHRSVGKGELAQVVTDHLGLDFHVVEVVAVVHTHNATDHLGNHDHVTQMSLHGLGTLVLSGSSLLRRQQRIQQHTAFCRRFRRAIGFLFSPRRKRRRGPAYALQLFPLRLRSPAPSAPWETGQAACPNRFHDR